MKDLQFKFKLDSSIPISTPEQAKAEPIHISGRADIVFDPGDGKPAIIWEIKLV